MGLGRKKCNKTTGCAFSDSEGNKKCKLILPINNLFTNTNNSILYFSRLADELIRVKIIRNFILKPKTYLSFQKINYDLKNDELILLEDILYNEYFDNLIPVPNNNFVNVRNTYDNTIPSTSIPYSNKFLSSALYDNISSQMDLHCIQEKDKLLRLNYWMKGRKVGTNIKKYGFDSNYKITEFKTNNNCSWEIFKQILKREGIDFTIEKIRSILITIYNDLTTKDKLDDIINIMKKENKRAIHDSLTSGTGIENIITISNYYLTTIDFFLLSERFNIPIIILTGVGNIWINKSKKISWLKDKEYIYIIYSTGWNVPDKTPTYGLLMKDDIMQIPIAELTTKNILDELTENNISSFDEFITMSNRVVKKNKKMGLTIDTSKSRPVKAKKKKGMKLKLKSSISTGLII
jgi:hypothetical protein